MLNNYHPIVKASIAYLKLIDVKVHPYTVNEALLNHPDWPSLLSVSDSFKKWKIPNAAAKLNEDLIELINSPFIMCLDDTDYPLAIINRSFENKFELLHKDYSKLKVENKEAILKKWTGIVLISEPIKNSGELKFKETVLKHNLKYLMLFMTAFFSLYLLLSNVIQYHSISHISLKALIIHFSILIVGAIVIVFLILNDFQYNSPILKKLCNANANTNCSAVLSSKQAKLFNWLSLTDIGLIYFFGSILSIEFGGLKIDSIIQVICWLNIISIPLILYSFYVQWKIIKQWCTLCIIIQSLLIVGIFNSLYNDLLFRINFNLNALVQVVISYLIILLSWFQIKPILIRYKKLINEKIEFNRLKYDYTVFYSLIKKNEKEYTSYHNIGIVLGNPNATNELIKVCNPYCGPCARMHHLIESLLTKRLNIKIRIIFTATGDKNDSKTLPVAQFLSISEKYNEEYLRNALDYWYSSEEKNYQEFKNKFGVDDALNSQKQKILDMNRWCKNEEITATPTLIFNGYKLPDTYSLTDLEYFLLD